MTRKFLALVILLTAVAVLYAQDDKTVKITGYVIDNACAGAHMKDADFADKVKKHSRSCALMDSCLKSGYAVYSENKLYKFDQDGNKTVADLIKDTETKTGIMVAVEGTLDGDTLHIKKIMEVKESTN